MFPRYIAGRVREALADTPVVLLVGPRQAGKSTLVRELLAEPADRAYLTLDDTAILAAAKTDPAGFVAGLAGPVCIDEVQRAPELLLPMKAAVDRERTPGRFLLTGSADVLALPTVADSLAGRMEVLALWPLAQCEIEACGAEINFVDALFGEGFAAGPGPSPPETRESLVGRAIVGGFPPAVDRPRPERRRAWFASYVTTILDRDVRDLAAIEGLSALPSLMGLLAARASGLLNYTDLASSLGVSQPTVKRYTTLLERLFLVRLVPAWSKNLGVRLTKSPKVYMGDTGLAAHVLGAGADRLSVDSNLAGSLVENFAVLELLKLATWSAAMPRAYHFRTSDGREVDTVLELDSGEIAGVEVKAGATVASSDFHGLRTLKALAPERFRRGVVLYSGSSVVPFGEDLFAVPFGYLWRPRE